MNHTHNMDSSVSSTNFVVLGDQSIASTFGKKGTQTDLCLYDKKESKIVRTWVAPTGFPDKIQPLFQAIGLAEFVIIHLNTLDRFTGEQIVALDLLGKKSGFLSNTFDVDETRLSAMIKGTVLENYTKTTLDTIHQKIMQITPASTQNKKTLVIIDHCFDVKGVGTVILGRVTGGTVSQYDTLTLLPAGVDVTVKSIQMHDETVPQAGVFARVGLSLKGVKPDQVNRGDILCVYDDNNNNSNNSIKISNKLVVDFTQTPYYKGDITTNQMYLVSIGLQIKAAKISSTNPFTLDLEKSIVHDTTHDTLSTVVLLKPESDGIRIVGSGSIICD